MDGTRCFHDDPPPSEATLAEGVTAIGVVACAHPFGVGVFIPSAGEWGHVNVPHLLSADSGEFALPPIGSTLQLQVLGYSVSGQLRLQQVASAPDAGSSWTRNSALLSIQRALWEEVTPELRAVTLRIASDEVRGRMIYDHTPDEDEIESCSVVETYLIADLPPHVSASLQAIASAPSDQLVLLPGEEWVFLRKEPS